VNGMGGGANTRDAAITEILDAAKVPQAQRGRWLRRLADLERWELAAAFYLMDDCHRPLATALEEVKDVQLSEASLVEVAQAIFDDIYLPTIPEAVHSYIDYESFAYDCRIGGDLREFSFSGSVWTCTSRH
jgi:hypothetical protein